MPRRRTFFGNLSIKGLRNLIFDRKGTDITIERMDHYKQDIPVELIEQNATDIEIRLAAQRELERRMEREAEGKAKLEKNKGRRL